MKAVISWSGGKDSMLALYYARQQGTNIQALLTSVNKSYDRISMHGVRKALLIQQATCLQVPLHTIELPEEPGMQEYEDALNKTYSVFKSEGFNQVIFGDIFLEDLKSYREIQLVNHGLRGIFPLWKIDTGQLMREFISLGFKAIVVCVNAKFMDKSFCGRIIDESFIKDLPQNADVCGENGEFHTFVFDGPIFNKPVPFTKGEIVYKKYAAPKQPGEDCFLPVIPETYGFYFCDLLPN